jgi:hypothetical protein
MDIVKTKIIRDHDGHSAWWHEEKRLMDGSKPRPNFEELLTGGDMKDPALDPRSGLKSQIQTSFPQASEKAIENAVRVLRESNRKNGGA